MSLIDRQRIQIELVHISGCEVAYIYGLHHSKYVSMCLCGWKLDQREQPQPESSPASRDRRG